MYSENDYRYYSEDELAHYGIMGQKWGVRNYQNPDGSLTPEGKIRYGSNSSESFYKRQSRIRKGVMDQEKVQRMENRGKTGSNRYRKYKDLADTRLADASEAEIKLAKNMIQDYRNQSVAYVIAGLPGAITYDIVESMLPSGRERRELMTQAHREYNARRDNS